MRVRRVLTAVVLSGIFAGPVHARQGDTINIYRYILGVDVPASPSLVGFGVHPGVPIGSSPKPVSLSATSIVRSEGSDLAVGFDIAPYYLFGGGIRTFENYRSMSVAGRLTRVLTKTILSIGALRAVSRPGTMDLAIAVRSTFHDPHDVPTQSAVIAESASAFDRAGRSLPPIDEARLGGWGVDLEDVFARARTAVRSRAGDVQVSGGWAMVVEVRDGVIHADSLGPSRHVGWITAQYTANLRYDLSVSMEYRNAFRSDDRVAGGLALRRKSDRVDVQSGVMVDITHGALEPALTVAGRVTAHLGVIGAAVVRADAPLYVGPRRLSASLTAQWFYASDR